MTRTTSEDRSAAARLRRRTRLLAGVALVALAGIVPASAQVGSSSGSVTVSNEVLDSLSPTGPVAGAPGAAGVPLLYPPPSDPHLFTVTLGHGGLLAAVDQALSLVKARGGAIVRRSEEITAAPEDETEAIVDAFEARGLRVVPTHFGRIEDLRTDNTTNSNTDQLGYTDAAIADVLEALVGNGWLAEDADVVVERGGKDASVPWPEKIAEDRVRRYGTTALCYGHAL